MNQTGVWAVMLLVMSGSLALADPVDELSDLGGVVPVVQYKNLDPPFSGADFTPPVYLPQVGTLEYVVWVKNQNGDPLITDSLIVVVDAIVEISGKDISKLVEIEGYDGITKEGKPFFRIPSTRKEIPPGGESESVTIRIDNPNFHRFFPPKVRVRGIRRSPEKSMNDLVESLMQKGVLSPEEGKRALESSSSHNP